MWAGAEQGPDAALTAMTERRWPDLGLVWRQPRQDPLAAAVRKFCRLRLARRWHRDQVAIVVGLSTGQLRPVGTRAPCVPSLFSPSFVVDLACCFPEYVCSCRGPVNNTFWMLGFVLLPSSLVVENCFLYNLAGKHLTISEYSRQCRLRKRFISYSI